MRNLGTLRSLVLAAGMLALPVASQAGLIFSVNIGPPVLPVYEQPLCPGPGYMWTPGYWAYGDQGYFWVPGTWVLAPFSGALWTPGYWGWGNGAYLWHAGYWGLHIGFYGGINYGFGYGGFGYNGGYWNGGNFFYNRSYSRVTNNITNVYNKTVINNYNNSNVSYNGGRGGLTYQANADQQAAYRGRRMDAVASQSQHVMAASQNRALYSSVNHGVPSIAATARPGAFNGPVTRPGQAAPGTFNSGQRFGNSANRPPSARPSPGFQSPSAASRPSTGQRFGSTPAYQNARPQNQPQSQGNSRPQFQSAPRPQYQSPSRPQYQSAPRPQSAPRQQYQSAPRPQSQPHFQSAPRPQSAPRSGGDPHRR